MKYWYLIFSALFSFIAYQLLGSGEWYERIPVAIMLGFILGITVIVYAGIRRRLENGIDLFATLKSDPEKVKADMLFIMQYGHRDGISAALDEFNDIFRNYPQWRLQDWVVFRAWYKDLVDHALKYPDIYILGTKHGDPYDKENDLLYDPDAPDWAQFDRKHYYDDDDDDDFDDEDDNPEEDYDIGQKKIKESASEGFYLGVGLGAPHNPLSN